MQLGERRAKDGLRCDGVSTPARLEVPLGQRWFEKNNKKPGFMAGLFYTVTNAKSWCIASVCAFTFGCARRKNNPIKRFWWPAATWTCRQRISVERSLVPKHIGNWALKYHLPCFLPLRCSGLCDLVQTSRGVLYAIGKQLCCTRSKKSVGAAKMGKWALNYNTVLLPALFCSSLNLIIDTAQLYSNIGINIKCSIFSLSKLI